MIYFLRRIPRDPFFPDGSARPPTPGDCAATRVAGCPQPGDDVYDVYSLAPARASMGCPTMTGETQGRGFTLIELLVVMAIIATLLTIAVPRYFTRSSDRARRSSCTTSRVARSDRQILRRLGAIPAGARGARRQALHPRNTGRSDHEIGRNLDRRAIRRSGSSRRTRHPQRRNGQRDQWHTVRQLLARPRDAAGAGSGDLPISVYSSR